MSVEKLEELLNSPPVKIRQLTKQSIGWFKTEVAHLRKIRFSKRKFLLAESQNVTKRPEIGYLYMFQYIAKHQDTLPVWDEYPLIIPFEFLPDGFLGVNFHYLPYRMRAWILWKLGQSATRKKQRLRVSYEILKAFSSAVGEYATKRYLYSQIASPFRKIEKDQYPMAIMIPIQKFHGEQAKMWSKRV